MLKKSFPFMLIAMMTLMFSFILGCSDDKSTSSAGYHSADFMNYTALIEEIAPPVYDGSYASGGPQMSPGVNDEFISEVLGKVFSEDEPMSLYWNLDELDGSVDFLNNVLKINDSTGEYLTEETWVEIDSLDSPTVIPASCQDVIGISSVDLDILVKISPPSFSGMEYHIGFKTTNSQQTILAYFIAPNQDNPSYYETFLFYANCDTVANTVEIKGVFYKAKSSSESDRWVYAISTADVDDFDYRMSWYADPEGSLTESLLGCIVGGGNKADKFAMKYNQYIPADTSVIDVLYQFTQMFDSTYANAGDLTSSYENYVNSANLFLLEDMPTELIISPWAD